MSPRDAQIVMARSRLASAVAVAAEGPEVPTGALVAFVLATMLLGDFPGHYDPDLEDEWPERLPDAELVRAADAAVRETYGLPDRGDRRRFEWDCPVHRAWYVDTLPGWRSCHHFYAEVAS